MKLYIMTMLAFGSVFASPASMTKKQVTASTLLMEQENTFDPTRGVFSFSVDPGVLVPGDLGVWIDTTIAYRSRLAVVDGDLFGNAHKLSFSINPVANMYFWERSSKKANYDGFLSIFTLGYQNLNYLNPRGNTALYFGGGISSTIIRTVDVDYPYLENNNGVKKYNTIILPALDACLGVEMNRAHKIPMFIEAGISAIHIDATGPLNLYGKTCAVLYYPKIRFGVSY